MANGFRYRKNIASIQGDKDEFRKLRIAYTKFKEVKPIDNRGFYYLAGYHGIPGFFCWHNQRSFRTILRGRVFLPWHRIYLHQFEQELRKISNSDVTIPWWDWTSEDTRKNGIPRAFAEKEIEGEPNPLYNSEIPYALPPEISSTTARGDKDIFLGNIRRLIPTWDELQKQIKARSDFGDFDDYLERLHNTIHGSVGGHMSIVPVSSFDPIFWSHHAMVDRIWYLWQLEHGYETGFENMLNLPLAPFDAIIRDSIRTVELGYDYVDNVVTVTANS